MHNPLQPSTTRIPLRLAWLAIAVFLVSAPAAHAQQSGTATIEQQMSADEFKATGLDRLDAEQLARLNAWLNRTIQAESGRAAETAQNRIKEENRGFLNFGTDEPIRSRISGEFRGFGQGRRYTLDNGQVWQQVDSASLAGVRLDRPEVTISPSVIGNTWFMSVGRYNTRAKVQRIK